MAERPAAPLSIEDLIRERFSDIRGAMAELGTTDGRRRFGRAFIAEALHDAQTPRFRAALQRMQG